MLSIVGLVIWLLNLDQPVAAAPARHSCAPPPGAGSRRKAHGSEQRRQGSDAGLDAALRWGIDHEESRAAAVRKTRDQPRARKAVARRNDSRQTLVAAREASEPSLVRQKRTPHYRRLDRSKRPMTLLPGLRLSVSGKYVVTPWIGKRHRPRSRFGCSITQ
jgi:hypothetical protein